MDKFMNNRWFMKIVALLLALMLFMSVSFETQPSPPGPSFPTASRDVETLTDVPITTYYDSENLVISGMPQYAKVTLEGPTGVTKTASLQRDIEVFADLRDLGIGTHNVNLKYRNVSEKIEVIIDPATVRVTIQERVSENYPVEVDFINKDKIKEGYIAEEPIVKPNSVKIIGAKEEVEKIALVKAIVDLTGVNETVETEARVAVYDKNGNVLSVEVEPSVVDITVPISSPSKKVPFKINRKGTLQQGLSIVNIEAIPSEITVYGPKEIIDKIEFIDGVTVDISELTNDTTLDIPIPVPEGVKKISPEVIKVTIEIEKEESRTFTNLPIQTFGLREQLQLEFIDPENGTLDVEVLGAPTLLDEIDPSDIELYINLTDIGIGEHNIRIEVNGPQNISWVLPRVEVKVNITEKP
ncbi:YbbR-like domain-containing protein [Bacillus luteolus]|uniref:YbbR-like domain-containing protein n=1 Tax=Litchfieldia luteola TaxID=682179 RepID=A0ABR9QMG6_9BACI|nr:CdaR family protein [Cytobacillus luteolus]MBE4909690.1 YbbR-like domain-containing protein [Cytobacillus luteolus]MBP1944556.1 YbbR domain-containing protein [Cytobacillus luteolus]